MLRFAQIGSLRSWLTVAYRVVGAVLAISAANALMEAGRLINLLTGPAIPWYTLFAFGLSLATLRWCDNGYEPLSTGQSSRRRALMIALLLGVGLAALGLILTAHAPLRAGRVALPGEAEPAPIFFHLAASYTKAGTAGLVEEAVIRGLVQLGLQTTIKPRWAEIIAGLEFVLLHGSQLKNPGELLLVSSTALVNGRLTALTQSTRYAVIVHCVSNLGITSGILLFRALA